MRVIYLLSYVANVYCCNTQCVQEKLQPKAGVTLGRNAACITICNLHIMWWFLPPPSQL